MSTYMSPGFRIRNPHYFGKPDPLKVKIKEMQSIKIEPLRSVDAHNSGVWAQYVAAEGLYSVDHWSQIRITLMRSRIRIRIKVKCHIRIRIYVMRI